jgi:hypothetical protein
MCHQYHHRLLSVTCKKVLLSTYSMAIFMMAFIYKFFGSGKESVSLLKLALDNIL